MNDPQDILIALALTLGLVSFLFITIKHPTIMATFEEMQATLAATNTALTNISDEMGTMQNEIDALKEQLGNMGLTADQESVIAEGLQSLRTRAENISTVIEGAPTDPEQPSEETPA